MCTVEAHIYFHLVKMSFFKPNTILLAFDFVILLSLKNIAYELCIY